MGPDATQKLKNAHQKKYLSVCAKLKAERLKRINEGYEVSGVFKDLQEKGTACGTRVTIRIEIEE